MRPYSKVFANTLALFAMSGCAPRAVAPLGPTPLTCNVDLSSRKAGRLEVSRIDPSPKLPFAIPLWIGWHPPAVGSSIDLSVAYLGGRFENLNSLSGGYARFIPAGAMDAEPFEATVSADGVQIAHFNKDDITVGPHVADVDLNRRRPNAKAVLTAIENKQRIEIKIFKNGQPFASETFDTSATSARDQLVAQARQLIQTSDPKVCRPI